MALLGRKLVMQDDGQLAHWCPACGRLHAVQVRGDDTVAHWDWNGDAERPSLAPSVRIRRWRGRREMICHYILRDGVIVFLADSSHILIGRCVPLPDVPVQHTGG
jgi:hypothetical protein